MTIDSTLARDLRDDVLVASTAIKMQLEGQLKTKVALGEVATDELSIVVHRPVRKDAIGGNDAADDDLLWEEFWATGSVVARNRLVEMYLHIVDAVVRRMPYDTLRHWDADDLKGFGCIWTN